MAALETREAARTEGPQRIAGAPKLRHELAEDFARSEDEPSRARRRGGVRITLPSSFPGTAVGRSLIGVTLLAMAGLFVAALWQARRYLLEDQRFVLASSSLIHIDGDRHVTRGQLLTVFDEDLGRNLLTVSLPERRDALERLPWVEHATVMRLLPNRLRIEIAERAPVAFYRQGGRIGLVDANGVLLDLRSQTRDAEPGEIVEVSPYSFPVVSGIAAEDPAATRAARMKLFERFMTDLHGSEDGIVNRLSDVDLSSIEDVKALISTGTSEVLVHFGENHFLERYRRFEENLPKWKADYPKLASADMRYPRQVVLEMEAGTAVPTAGGGVSPPAISKAKTPPASKALLLRGSNGHSLSASRPRAQPPSGVPTPVPGRRSVSAGPQ